MPQRRSPKKSPTKKSSSSSQGVNNSVNISSADMSRLAAHVGITRISASGYNSLSDYAHQFLVKLLHDASVITRHGDRKIITEDDIEYLIRGR